MFYRDGLFLLTCVHAYMSADGGSMQSDVKAIKAHVAIHVEPSKVRHGYAKFDRSRPGGTGYELRRFTRDSIFITVS